ncbi:hypothetical protein [Sphingomonas sp. NFX23]|uniref:AbiU2 domain-containing protein n=1 Tax=Sphingomonas sp. NFX23 TaxID=2819532 RepID=UPI003CEEEDA9
MTSSPQALPIERQIADLTHQVARARIFYDLWWQLQGEPRDQHIDGMNLYPDFFRFSQHAYLYAMIVQSMVPFDQRASVLSFKSVFKRLRKAGALSPELAKADARLNGSAHLWKGMKLVRDECFAHRSMMATYDDVWTRAKVRPRDIHDALAIAMEVVALLRTHVGLAAQEFHPAPGEEFAALLSALQKQATG